jgi:hypothetical protein
VAKPLNHRAFRRPLGESRETRKQFGLNIRSGGQSRPVVPEMEQTEAFSSIILITTGDFSRFFPKNHLG